MAVIILKNGDKIETKEDYMAVTKKYSEASWADATELMRWMGSADGGPFPNPQNPFTVTDRKTGKEISLCPEQVNSLCPEQVKTIVKEDNEQLTDNAKRTIVTLTSGKEIIVSEDFDMVYSIWEHKPAVILLTEKNTGNRLAISTKSIAMLG